ncbi:MAG: glycosyltransferase [Chloroflexi bacterium]|nr:glycosyltransferase [Chloroflexota bacterium]MBK7916270.1 glycosyltransferase [Chloroflexota bacterium]MBP6803982.1 glycosyltransferase [Chloroflexota bacterium]MBP7591712.1 glycosyltransferase [Chloroflexota bacterium]
MTQQRVAIIVQRYGEEVSGGAELHARWLAERLLPLAEIHVLTTCAVDYVTWANEYPAKTTLVNGVTVHRFAVDQPRDWAAAQKQTQALLLQEHSLFDEIAWVKAQGPYSTALLTAVRQSYANFDAFIFFTYLYATTYFGLPLVSDKAILVPTAHDEPFLYLPVFRPLFHLPRAIVYNTLTEKGLVNRVTGNHGRAQDIIAGVGVNLPDHVSAERFRQKYQIDGPFLLYVGRIAHGKNVPELLEDFQQFRQHQKDPLKLVLIGKANFDLPTHPDIVPLGFLSEQDKFDALQAASVVVMPSLYESLSMIVLEAWLMGRPVLVNGRCAVLRNQCRRSNGGLYYTSYDEFSAALQQLLSNPSLRQQLGRQGQRFAQTEYHWDTIIHRYKTLLTPETP